MREQLDHDVLIAGAGPAGAHTALRLARRGWSVALLDKRSFPRRKPCGEFLSPACLPLLDELDLLAPLHASSAARVTGMQLCSGAASVRGEYAPLGPFAASHGHGLGIRREVLDELAVRAAEQTAGVTVLFGWRVSAALCDATGRVIGLSVTDPSGAPHRLRARFVVGADGLESRVARTLGWSESRRGPDRFAVVARFRGVEERARAGLHVTGSDYLAACPIDEGLFTANLVVDRAALPKGVGSLEPFFLERLQRAPALADQLATAVVAEPVTACGPLGARVRRCAGPGAALVGDACGFVDPMTGEGLWFAMEGARLLAAAVDLVLRDRRREREVLRGYERARRREFSVRYALARLLQHGLRRPGVPDRVVGAMVRVPALCRLMLALTGDYLPPSALVSPRVWRSALSA